MLVMKDAFNSDKKMLCTDLDGTFIGDDESMYELLRIIDGKDFLTVFFYDRAKMFYDPNL